MARDDTCSPWAISRTRNLVKSQARSLEERKIPGLLSKLKSYADGPDISDSKRGFLPDKLPLVPRLMAVSSNSVHGSSTTLREDKGGSVTIADGRYPTQSGRLRI
jgi:hypothetical protein